jgi:signal peptide peptidase SppA
MSETDTATRGNRRYPHIARKLSHEPWAIHPKTLAAIHDLVRLRATGVELSDEEVRTAIGAGPARRDTDTAGGVAVIPVYGVITPRADLMTEISGGTSVERLQGDIRGALANSKVGAILLNVDSPGGSTDLIEELGNEIRQARDVKPIVAVANTMAASAAYWLAAQAGEVYVTPSGGVGSIGVFTMHEDISGMEEKLGVKTTLVSAGKYKTEGNPFEPLDEEARAELQRLVDEFYGKFIDAVAAGRGVTSKTVREDFGQGRMLTAARALDAGMVDGVAPIERVLGSMLADNSARITRARHAVAVVEAPSTGFAALPRAEVDIDDDVDGAAGDPAPEPSEDSLATDTEAGSTRRVHAELAGDPPLSFVMEATAARDAVDALLNRTRSLAELRRGRLTAAKREQLSAIGTSLEATTSALAELLASTDPTAPRTDLSFELEAEFQRQRFNLHP